MGGSNELHTPLLPHGSDDTIADDINPYDPTDEPAHAASKAVANGYTQRRPSTVSAAQRRRKRLEYIKEQASDISRRVSNVSNATPSSEVSRQLERRDSTQYTSSGGDDDSDDESSDYGGEAIVVDEKLKEENMSWGIIAKASLVVIGTLGALASYAAGFVVAATVPLTLISSTAAAMSTLGVAAGVILLSSPLVWVSEWRLAHLPALRKRVNELRREADRFQRQVDYLVLEEQDLMVEVESLQANRERLEELVDEKNAGNVDELVDLVHQNQIILKQMKENLRQVVLQDVVKIVLQSDSDHDGMISKKEADILETRLLMSMQIYGIVFDTVKFHRAVGLSPSLCGVMTIVKRLLPDEDDRVSTFYDTIVSDSEDEDDEEDEGEEDIYDMFYVRTEDQFKKGCAECIQLCKEYRARKGERPSLMSMSPSFRKSLRSLRSRLSTGDTHELGVVQSKTL